MTKGKTNQLIENSSDEVAKQMNSRFIQQLNEKVKSIKASKKVRKKYMPQVIRSS